MFQNDENYKGLNSGKQLAKLYSDCVITRNEYCLLEKLYPRGTKLDFDKLDEIPMVVKRQKTSSGDGTT